MNVIQATRGAETVSRFAAPPPTRVAHEGLDLGAARGPDPSAAEAEAFERRGRVGEAHRPSFGHAFAERKRERAMENITRAERIDGCDGIGGLMRDRAVRGEPDAARAIRHAEPVAGRARERGKARARIVDAREGVHGRGRIGDMGRHDEIAPVVHHAVAVDQARHAVLAGRGKKPRRAGDPGDIGEKGVRALGQARWQPGGVVGRAHIGVAGDETLPFRVDEDRRGRRPQARKTLCEAAIDAGRFELRDDFLPGRVIPEARRQHGGGTEACDRVRSGRRRAARRR